MLSIGNNMVSMPNRFYNGWCSNAGNPRSHIIHYLIRTIRDISDYDGGHISEEVNNIEEYFNLDSRGLGDPYYAVYASFKFDFKTGPIKIFEGDDLRTAIFIVETLSGNKAIENDTN
jgi:hypothetical protein